MSCDHELANEWARCSGKNASYITRRLVLPYGLFRLFLFVLSEILAKINVSVILRLARVDPVIKEKNQQDCIVNRLLKKPNVPQ